MGITAAGTGVGVGEEEHAAGTGVWLQWGSSARGWNGYLAKCKLCVAHFKKMYLGYSEQNHSSTTVVATTAAQPGASRFESWLPQFFLFFLTFFYFTKYVLFSNKIVTSFFAGNFNIYKYI